MSMNEDGPEYGETLNIMDLSLGRTAEPESTDGHVGYKSEMTASCKNSGC